MTTQITANCAWQNTNLYKSHALNLIKHCCSFIKHYFQLCIIKNEGNGYFNSKRQLHVESLFFMYSFLKPIEFISRSIFIEDFNSFFWDFRNKVLC